ncbi:hypothetical protein ABT369_15520 [Dactylosporangium sp. NPDC000244]|uniref:hypothetical protein n=1 Tax=Dactylosporangium sp. NPDC000244 TaxID=3154365 RepID=UPI0033231BAB
MGLVPESPEQNSVAQVDSPTAESLLRAAEKSVPALKLAEIRISITLAIVSAILSVGLLLLVALWFADFPAIENDGQVSARSLFELVKLVFAVVAGIGGVAALVVAYRRQRVAEHGSKIAEFAHRLAQAADERAEISKLLAQAADERAKLESDRNGVRLFHERFAKASEQLGASEAAIRLAGVYAMAGLADDWEDGRQTCVDVLCAYIRMPYSPANETDDQPIRFASRQEREVRNTVLRLAASHLRGDASPVHSWQGLRLDFTGATFDGADFSYVRILEPTKIIFDYAMFVAGRTTFTGAQFLASVSFRSIRLVGGTIDFSGARFLDGGLSFRYSVFTKGSIEFADGGSPSLVGGFLDFSSTKFHGAGMSFGYPWEPFFTMESGRIKFDHTEFNTGSQWWAGKLNGGRLSYEWATFKGTRIDFTEAEFNGTSVEFHPLSSKEPGVPPKFGDAPLRGVKMPDAWRMKPRKDGD